MTTLVGAAVTPRSGARDARSQDNAVAVSVIVPVSERADDLVGLYREFAAPLAAMGRAFELVFALEPWHRSHAKAVTELAAQGAPVRALVAGQALGESSLLRAAITHCRGGIVVTLPAYRRVEAACLPVLVDRIAAGADLVVATRSPRRDPWFNRLQAQVFHVLLRSATGTRFHDLGCGVQAVRREVLEQLPLHGDFLRFLPILATRHGYRVEEIAAQQHASDRGSRVYGPGTYLRRLIDVLGLYFLVRFTEKPLRFFGLVGSAVSLTGAALLLLLLIQRLQGKGLADRPLLLLAVLLVVLGVQATALGLVGEIIVHFSALHRRSYRLTPAALVPPAES